MAISYYHQQPLAGYQLTEGNIEEAATWCGGVYDAVKKTITVDLADGLYTIGIGDFITLDFENRFRVWTAQQFGPIYSDQLALTSALVVNGVPVVRDQVPAIGLNAKTDTNKITDIIAALRAHGLIGPNA